MTKQEELELAYRVLLWEIPGIGAKTYDKLLRIFISAKDIWVLSLEQLRELSFLTEKSCLQIVDSRKKHNPEKYLQSLCERSINVLERDISAEYPKRLSETKHTPPIIYYSGNFQESDYNAIAIVGTRKPTEYGQKVTEYFAYELAKQGYTIISGLAYGVDAIAHKAALDAGARTIAVLGSGLHHIQPQANAQLAQKIIGNGALLSTFPPNEPAFKGHFVARNETVACLAGSCLVTEAAKKSGSLITANFAWKHDRNVFAVPGSIYAPQSIGALHLIDQGASPAIRIESILNQVVLPAKDWQTDDPIQQELWQLLQEGETEIDVLVRKSQFDSKKVMQALAMMELEEVIAINSDSIILI